MFLLSAMSRPFCATHTEIICWTAGRMLSNTVRAMQVCCREVAIYALDTGGPERRDFGEISPITAADALRLDEKPRGEGMSGILYGHLAVSDGLPALRAIANIVSATRKATGWFQRRVGPRHDGTSRYPKDPDVRVWLSRGSGA